MRWIAHGFSALGFSDHEILKREWIVYDALYAETFFGLFAQRKLAIEVFTVLEDLRLDEWSKRRYPGLTHKSVI